MFSTVATRYITIAVQLLVVFLTLEIFGLEGRGTLAALIGISGFSGALLSFTIGKGLVRVINEIEDFEQNRKLVYSSFLFLIFVLSCLSLAVQFIVYNLFPELYGSIGAAPFYSFLVTSFYYVWVQVGPYIFSFEGKLGSYNKLSLFFNFLIVAVCCYFYFLGANDFLFFVKVYAAFLFSEGMLGFLILFYNVRSIVPQARCATRILWSGATLHLDTIGGVMFSSVTLIIVNATLDVESVAIYDIGIKLFSLLCVFPQMVQLFNSRNVVFSEGSAFLTQQLIFFMKVIKLFLLIIAPLCFLMYLLLKNFGYNQDITYIFVFFSFAFPAYFYCSIISPYWIKHGFSAQLSITTLVIGGLGVLIAITLVKTELALYGAVAAVVFNYIVAAMANYLFYKKILMSECRA